MPSGLDPISQKQFKVTIDGIECLFTKCSGPEEVLEQTEYDDGETGQTLVHLGFLKVSPLTLSVNYDPVKHAALIAWWQQHKKDRKRFTVSIQAVNKDVEGTALTGSKTLQATSCQCARFKYPETDREASGMAKLEIEVVPQAIAVQ